MTITQTTELSYTDLLTSLKKDLESDESMPQLIKDIALAKTNELFELINPYSA